MTAALATSLALIGSPASASTAHHAGSGPLASPAAGGGATMMVTPSQGLPDDQSTLVTISASGLTPSTTVYVLQCEDNPKIAAGWLCDVLGGISTDPQGNLVTQADVSYLMFDDQTGCDTNPNTVPPTSCDVELDYTYGSGRPTPAASAPITFADHAGPPQLGVKFGDDAGGEAVESQPVTYTASVSVANADEGDQISLQVTFPDGLDPQTKGLGGTGWTCGIAGQVVACTLPGQTVGSAPDVSLPAVVDVSDPYTGETLATTAAVSSDDATGDQAEDDVTFIPGSRATCPAGQSCSASASSPAAGESATVTDLPGQQTGYVTANFGGDVAPIHPCTSTSTSILTFSGNRQKDVTVTASTSSEFKRICYGQPTPFLNWKLKKTTYFNPANKEYEGILPACKKNPAGPCVSSLSYSDGVEQVVVFSGAGDPHFAH